MIVVVFGCSVCKVKLHMNLRSLKADMFLDHHHLSSNPACETMFVASSFFKLYLSVTHLRQKRLFCFPLDPISPMVQVKSRIFFLFSDLMSCLFSGLRLCAKMF